MQFLVTWQIHDGKLHDTLRLFAGMPREHEEALMGEEVTLKGRWHDLVRGTGVAICEATSAEAMTAYALQWNRHMDLDISLVVDDDGARALGSSLGEG